MLGIKHYIKNIQCPLTCTNIGEIYVFYDFIPFNNTWIHVYINNNGYNINKEILSNILADYKKYNISSIIKYLSNIDGIDMTYNVRKTKIVIID